MVPKCEAPAVAYVVFGEVVRKEGRVYPKQTDLVKLCATHGKRFGSEMADAMKAMEDDARLAAVPNSLEG